MKNPKTINITPTWELGLAPVMINIIKNSPTPESTKIAEEELLKMARVADKYIEISSYKDGECVEQYVDLKDSE